MDYGNGRAGERGNVLFLVLIAVVLFAALSYAVTQSTRQQGTKPGQGDLIGAAELNQYPAALRMTTLTMAVEGIAVDELEFNPPADFAALSSIKAGVFHPDGGGASYQMAAAALMAANDPGMWYYNMEFEIENIGLSAGSSFTGNDLIAFLPGIKEGICAKVNDHIGLSTIPQASADLSGSYKVTMDNMYVLPGGETVLGAAGGNGTNDLTGQPFGCFRNADGDYVYYQVLMDR